MNKNVLVLGVLLFFIGLIMWYVGQENYQKAQVYYILGGTQSSIDFWYGFSTIGFIFFILGIPLSIAGAVIEEKKDFTFQKPIAYIPEKPFYNTSIQPIQQNTIQPIQKPATKEFFCPNCGTKLDSFPAFCFNCGHKLR